jgi:DNA-binding transcriptional LysR family regulator
MFACSGDPPPPAHYERSSARLIVSNDCFRLCQSAYEMVDGMELRHLEYFVAVAEERNFTRAAARVHIVQSAISSAIKSLERELGTPLLERTSRRVLLTDAGTVFLPKARATLDAARDARDAVDEVRGGLRGMIRIGTMTSVSLVDVPALLGRYHQRWHGHGQPRRVPHRRRGHRGRCGRPVQVGGRLGRGHGRARPARRGAGGTVPDLLPRHEHPSCPVQPLALGAGNPALRDRVTAAQNHGPDAASWPPPLSAPTGTSGGPVTSGVSAKESPAGPPTARRGRTGPVF